jgi:hemolysin activation/secretion protein
MMKKKWTPCLLLLMAQVSWAQTLPSAGGQMQQMPPSPTRPDTLSPDSLTSPAPIRVKPQVAPAQALASTTMFKLERLQVTGATAFSEADLLRVAGFEPGHELSLPSLQVMAERITQHYRQRGFLVARAYLPAQEIRDGVGTLAVMEGQYGQVRVGNTSSLDSQMPKDLLMGLNHRDVITLLPLEERLLLLSDVPGVQVRSSLVPGASLGLSDLLVEVEPGARISGSVDADNAGNRYTGEERLGATVNLNNPTGRGDLASLRVLTSGSGLRYGRASYQAPWGRGRLGVSYSDLGYELGREFAALQANGHARIATVFGSYPLRRTRQSNMSIGLSLEAKTFQDRIDAEPSVTDKHAQVAVATWYGDQRDAWGGGGLNSYSLAWSTGTIDIRTPLALQRDADTARSDGRYNKLAFALSRVQRANESLTLSASLSGQMASKNLDVSEKMELGGMYGVRAYPEGEAYADEGLLLTLEARQQLRLPDSATSQVHLAVFVDAGTVKLHHKPWLAENQRRHLSGAGVGVYWTRSRDFSVKAFYAHKLGHEDALSAPDKSGRIWVQAVKYF